MMVLNKLGLILVCVKLPLLHFQRHLVKLSFVVRILLFYLRLAVLQFGTQSVCFKLQLLVELVLASIQFLEMYDVVF